ncbi:Calcipressin-domain-containing protein [Lipomyces japonicus]|uniref:Calcipressin-domain-containing protein n=1 Tax=Lipomyces japonicus TaxID=56871 RepID=UPI0034CFAFEA
MASVRESSALLKRRGSNKTVSLDLNTPRMPDMSVMSNTLIFTGLHSTEDFDPEPLGKLYAEVEAVSNHKLVHWGPLRSFGRIVVVFATVEQACKVKIHFDGMVFHQNRESRLRVYFGVSTEVGELLDAQARPHLELPDRGKMFLISPPPSPPVGWESGIEAPPNDDTGVGAHMLANALQRLNTSVESEHEDHYDEDVESGADQSPTIVIFPPAEDGKPGIVVSDHSTPSCSTEHLPWRTVEKMRTERPPMRMK